MRTARRRVFLCSLMFDSHGLFWSRLSGARLHSRRSDQVVCAAHRSEHRIGLHLHSPHRIEAGYALSPGDEGIGPRFGSGIGWNRCHQGQRGLARGRSNKGSDKRCLHMLFDNYVCTRPGAFRQVVACWRHPARRADQIRKHHDQSHLNLAGVRDFNEALFDSVLLPDNA